MVFDFVYGDRVVPVAIDYEDRPVLHDSAERFPLFFKMQHLRDGYGHANVKPGGFVTTKQRLYRLTAHYRRMHDEATPAFDAYGRFGMNWAQETRQRAADLLNEQTRFRYEGGLKLATWGEYMREACTARVCIDLPGRGPFCYRLVEYLAVGACVVGPRHATILHVPLVDGRDIGFTREDLTDLVDTVEHYVADAAGRQLVSEHARRFFDAYLRPEQLAAYYLHECIDACG